MRHEVLAIDDPVTAGDQIVVIGNAAINDSDTDAGASPSGLPSGMNIDSSGGVVQHAGDFSVGRDIGNVLIRSDVVEAGERDRVSCALDQLQFRSETAAATHHALMLQSGGRDLVLNDDVDLGTRIGSLKR